MTRLLIVTATLLVMTACVNKGDRGESEADSLPALNERRVEALARLHGAALEWETPFEAVDAPDTFTYDVQRALLRPDGQPVVLTGSIDDVATKDDGNLEVRIRGFYWPEPDLLIFLSMEPDRLAPILRDRPEWSELFAFVAKVDRVWRPILGLSAEQQSSEGDPEILFESPRLILVRGTGLDVIRLPLEE